MNQICFSLKILIFFVFLQILLPDREVVTVSVKKSANTEDVYSAVINKIGLNKNCAKYFYLFEIVEYNFGEKRSCYINYNVFYILFPFAERKLQPNEYPHNLYIQNYSTATNTCLSVRRWLFTLSRELNLMRDQQATAYIFWQVGFDVKY